MKGGNAPQFHRMSGQRNRASHVARDQVDTAHMAYTLKLHSSPKGKEEIDALTGARRDQFIAAAKGDMEGAPCKVPSDYFKYLAKENDGEVADQYAELWTAVKEGKDKPLYDLWYFPAAENGLVFEAGTARKAGVEIGDGSFEAADSASS